MAFTPSFAQTGDALLGQLARVVVLVLALLAPTTVAKSICWDYNDEEMGPLVPVSKKPYNLSTTQLTCTALQEWSSESDADRFNWSARRAEFA
ncbi:hypothetical protein PHMEG_00031161 [Phytophthora megakarya]|uniref:Uncharacterized protein n=1 Tax=Phytophthora megakarya TaxID=4795 RepID=A0A225UYZ1_9STRA|nr:hypothetical protein PHMEG_00031161 [Phytophthora megakarya]